MHCGDGCYEYQSSWPPSIFSSVLDSLRSYTTQNVCLPPYDISPMPCVCLFASYFEQQHQCRTCQCRRVNKPRDFRAFAFLRQRLVPAPVDGGAETCCALGFLVHIASNSANSKQEMKMKSECAKTSGGRQHWVWCVSQGFGPFVSPWLHGERACYIGVEPPLCGC